jgi:hypothetical protein
MGARARRADDWERDLRDARPTEQIVRAALAANPNVSHLSDFTAEMDALDFEFQFDGGRVRLDVKEKRRRLSDDICDLWPDVDEAHLFVLDETALRTLAWAEAEH